jgi:hypothetical protein
VDASGEAGLAPATEKPKKKIKRVQRDAGGLIESILEVEATPEEERRFHEGDVYRANLERRVKEARGLLQQLVREKVAAEKGRDDWKRRATDQAGELSIPTGKRPSSGSLTILAASTNLRFAAGVDGWLTEPIQWLDAINRREAIVSKDEETESSAKKPEARPAISFQIFYPVDPLQISHVHFVKFSQLGGEILMDVGIFDDQAAIAKLSGDAPEEDRTTPVKAFVTTRFGMSPNTLLLIRANLDELWMKMKASGALKQLGLEDSDAR